MVTDKGHVKVLDFGLAKLVETAERHESAATRTAYPQTEVGTIVGTAAYMSPEQAEGRNVDARSDIFSFGAVLYEMLTGRRAFDGTSSISTLAAILHHDPAPIHEFAPGVPRDMVQTVARCLRKDPQRRTQLMADVKLALEDVGSSPETPSAVASDVPRMRSGAVASALAALVVGAGLTFWLLQQSGGSTPVFTPFVTEAGQEGRPAWSPDGKTVAYLGEVKGIRQVLTRSLDTTTPTVVTNAPLDCEYLFWHPDGTHIYYTSPEELGEPATLWLVGILGGEPRRVIEEVVSGAASSDRKTIALLRQIKATTTLWTLSIQDGKAIPYKQAPLPETIRESAEVHFSPDGSKLGVVLNQQSGGGGFEFWVLPFPSGTPKRVLPSLSARAPVQGFAWMPDNRRLVFSAELASVPGRHLYMADTETDEIVPLTPGTGEEMYPTVSSDGSLAFVAGSTDADLIESPLEGGDTRALLATTRDEQFPSWSPNGSQYMYASDANGAFEIWSRSSADGWARPVVARTQDGLPLWYQVRTSRFSPEGSRIVYELWGRTHTIWISPVAGGRPVQMGKGEDDQHGPSWSPDGNQIAYARAGPASALVRSPVGGGAPTVIVPGVFSFTTDWSRTADGEAIAFSTTSNNPKEEFLGVQIVSPDGKNRKVLTRSETSVFGFSRDGSTMYVVRDSSGRWELASIDVRSASERTVSVLGIPATADVQGFSLSPDGRSFATSVVTTKHDIWLMEGLPPN